MSDTPLNCAVTGCFGLATARAVLMLRVDETTPAAEAVLGFAFCDFHQCTITPEKLTTDIGWRTLLDAFFRAGRKPPVREMTTLKFVPI